MAQPVVAMGLLEEDYQRISRMARKSRIGVRLMGKNGPVRFYYKDGQLYGDQRDKEGKVFTQPCVNMAEAMKQQKAATESGPKELPFKAAVLPRIRADHPDWTDEEVDAFADIIAEANESMKRLLASGVEEQLAANLVGEALLGNREFRRGVAPPDLPVTDE